MTADEYALFADGEFRGLCPTIAQALRKAHKLSAKTVHILIAKDGQKPDEICWVKPEVVP